MKRRIYCRVKLCIAAPHCYRVKEGQTLLEISAAFGVPPRLIAAVNALEGEPEAGRALLIPAAGNLYTVRGGESKSLLCGSPARFFERNKTHCLYPGQTVLLG